MKALAKTIAGHRVSRFMSVGVLNTLLDLVILNVLLVLSGNASNSMVVLAANTVSATTVAIFSFFVNRRFVFKAMHTPGHHALYFIAVTLSGLYIIQNAILYVVLHYFAGLAGWGQALLGLVGLGISQQFILVNAAKICATLGSMVWNYVWYSKVIFRDQKNHQPLADTTD